MAVIFAMSSSTRVPKLPAGLSDHTGHFIGYGLLGAFAIRAFARASWTQIGIPSGWRAIVLSSAYGVTDEYHQSFVSSRTPSVADWLADTLGATTAVLVIIWLARERRRGSV
jgi:VanZ family protein